MEPDFDALRAIEARASKLFAAHGFPDVGTEPWPPDDFAKFVGSNTSLVAVDDTGKPLGFAVASELHGIFWLKEISVDPEHGRRGIGTALVRAVEERARWAFHTTLGLSTFRDVPFNAPFYTKLGFVIADLKAAPAPIRDQVLREVPDGATVEDRVFMIRKL